MCASPVLVDMPSQSTSRTWIELVPGAARTDAVSTTFHARTVFVSDVPEGSESWGHHQAAANVVSIK